MVREAQPLVIREGGTRGPKHARPHPAQFITCLGGCSLHRKNPVPPFIVSVLSSGLRNWFELIRLAETKSDLFLRSLVTSNEGKRQEALLPLLSPSLVENLAVATIQYFQMGQQSLCRRIPS